MVHSTDRFLTTHTGSLPRPADLITSMFAKEEGVPVDADALAARIQRAVAEVVKRQAEAEGLHQVFVDAGLEWRETGCSMCCSFNGDQGKPQERWASTSNRNFVGRQGPQVRTHLVGPAMAAAAALTGRFTDVRSL